MSEFSCDNVVIPPNGIVNLKDKKYPICELHSLNNEAISIATTTTTTTNNIPSSIETKNSCHDYDPHYVYTRGYVDVSKFKAYLQSLPSSIWDDDNQDGNVLFRSHVVLSIYHITISYAIITIILFIVTNIIMMMMMVMMMIRQCKDDTSCS